MSGRSSPKSYRLFAYIAVIGLAAGCLFAYLQWDKLTKQQSTAGFVPQSAQERQLSEPPIVRSLPVRLLIPRIGVDSPVEYTGITSSGNMAVPSDISKTGWYKLGPLPGNKGSAVMSGHVNGTKGQPGVFARLPELKPGDTIETIDMNGLKATFIVQNTKRYAKDAQPEEVFHSAEKAHLNLITCVGDWNQAERQYSDRLVVFADIVL